MKTISVNGKNECGLSTSSNGGGGYEPSSCIFTIFGPNTPMCSHTDADPGPPLNENISGLLTGGLSSV